MNWWFERNRLDKEALTVFNRYYTNYRNNFDGYLKLAWSDRHLELENELEVLRNRPDGRVLDLGCGVGSVSLYMACKLQGRGEIHGVDINEERLSCAIQRKLALEKEVGVQMKCEFSRSNVLDLDEKDKFDLIYVEEALHHMEPRVEITRRISNMLKDGGILIVSEVNAYNPLMQLKLLKERGLKTIDKKVGKNGEEVVYGVERIIPSSVVAKLFGKNRLRVKSLRYFRMASSKLGRLANKNGIALMNLEKRLCKIALMSKIISIHYNIVFKK